MNKLYLCKLNAIIASRLSSRTEQENLDALLKIKIEGGEKIGENAAQIRT